ncbi:hypothetical protein ACX80L_05350 [Arthrobacter sp. MDT1-48-3]
MRRTGVAKPASVAATILFAGILLAWFWIKIQQGFVLGVAAGLQVFMVAAAALLFAPFLVLIYLCLKPQTVFKDRSSQGSSLFAGLGFIWLFCALFLSLFVGFAPF